MNAPSWSQTEELNFVTLLGMHGARISQARRVRLLEAYIDAIPRREVWFRSVDVDALERHARAMLERARGTA